MKGLKAFLLLITLSSCGSQEEKSTYLRHVGDIPFDPKLDDPHFKVCNEAKATVYYAFDKPHLYEGEKPAIEAAFQSIDFPKEKVSSGFITIRFMVNCEGATGRFRVEQLDFEYKDKTFDPNIVQEILSTCKSLDGWIPASYKDKTYDYYKYLTFKIEDNEITDILP